MPVFSSTCFYVNLILKQGEIFRNPKLLDNPLYSQREIAGGNAVLLPKPIEVSRRFSPVSVGFGLDPSIFWKKCMVYVLCKIQLVLGSLLTLALFCSKGHLEPTSPWQGWGHLSVLCFWASLSGFYLAFLSPEQQYNRTDKAKITSVLWGCMIHSTHSFLPQ